MATIKAKSAFTQVRSHEAIRRADPERVDLQPGDAYVQGDVIFARLDAAPRRSGDYPGRQLAPGETQGARHVAEGDCELYRPDEAAALTALNRLFPRTKGHRLFLGPVVVAAGDWTATHPEHGHRTFPAGAYLVTYQRSLTAEREVRRAAD